MPLASDWKTIGTLLQLKASQLDIIQADYRNQSLDCLRETLNLWLQVGPTCTWQTVAKVVELLDPRKAEEIRNKFVK